MTPVLLDTGYLLALELENDQNHAAAVEHWNRVRPGHPPLVTTSYVFDEVVTYLNSRGRHAKAVQVGNNLLASGALEFVQVNEALFSGAWAYFQMHQDKDYSLTDCISFVLMNQRNIATAYSFDRHFTQAGFKKEPNMGLQLEHDLFLTRRQLFGRSATGIGTAALASLLNQRLFAADADASLKTLGALPALHHAPRAKRVIYLFMSGGPSHIDLFDHHARLRDLHGTELPASIRMGQRITGMTSGQKSFPCVAPMFKFAQHGKCGAWVSELLPHIAGIVDDIAIVKSVNTEAINHDPAITYIQTGHQQPGRPSLGAWLSYGIGSENQNLPAFIVMISQGSGNKTDQPLFSRLWGSGFVPTQHQGVRFRSGDDPVLYLSNPPGVDGESRRRMLDGVQQLNELAARTFGDPEINTRIAQYEMAFRMQTSVPELTDLSSESKQTLEMYGIDDKGEDGGFARNCLLARRMIERGVRFVQLLHRGWDQHNNLPKQIRGQCKDVDRPSAALIKDLKLRGLLEDTLVIWGGEFGRTVYSQGPLTKDNHGRDHHGRCFTVWLAGGGIKPGISYGQTDDFCYNIVQDPVHIHDFNATILSCLGIDHTQLTFRFQGRDFRLTDVHGNVVRDLLA